jgi:hypothetical protein
MFSRFPRWAAVSAASAITLVGVLPQIAAAQTLAPSSCSFNLGFAALAEALPPALVGDCLENQQYNKANGNAEQHTSGGLFYWRKLDNVSAFTDGNTTWLNGPFGIQSRPSDVSFDWEVISPTPQLASDGQLGSVTNTVVLPTRQSEAPTVADVSNSAIPPDTTPPVAPVPVSLRNGNLTSGDRRGADLQNADFYRAKLVSTDFTGANLSGASLTEADVSRAVFAQANLTRLQAASMTSNGSKTSPGPIFYQANLNAANLSQAKLVCADFRQADLRSADLSRANLSCADLRGADLRGADLSQTNFTGANLAGANLTGANHTGAIFKDANTGGVLGYP